MESHREIRSISRTLIKMLCVASIAFLWCVVATTVFGGVTAFVPTDYSTIQDAVNAAQNTADPGEVIINSNGPFTETVFISQSVTVRAGSGFSPVMEPFDRYHSVIRIRANNPIDDTYIVIEGIAIQAKMDSEYPMNSVISIANDNGCDTLDVELNHIAIDAEYVQSGIAIASASINDDITFALTDSVIEILGEGAGSPECVRLDPYGYNLSSTLRNNTFRFSAAGGISIEGGKDDKLTSTIIDGNVFDGSDDTFRHSAIEIAGGGGDDSSGSPSNTKITNNLFLRTGAAVDVWTYPSHDYTMWFNNNTVVDSGVDSGSCDPAGVVNLVANHSCAKIYATLTNNIIVGSLGYGVKAVTVDSGGGGIELTNDYNLFYNNAAADYSGIGIAAGSNDLVGDPLFADPASDNYRVTGSSPAVDSGDNCPPGGAGFGQDLDGAPRVLDGNNDTVNTIDRGAYEYLGEVYGCISLKGEPLVDVQVELIQKDEEKQITFTNADGCYQFGGVVPGEKFDIKVKIPLVP